MLLKAAIPASELALRYFRRWSIELRFHEVKTHLNKDVLCCLPPTMIEREVRRQFIIYNLIRCFMQNAALAHLVNLCCISFKGCLDAVRHFANTSGGTEGKACTISALAQDLLHAIARNFSHHRSERSEPCVRKRRPKITASRQIPAVKWDPCPTGKPAVNRVPNPP